MLLVVPAHAQVLEQITTFHIRPEPLRMALLDLGRQAHVQVILPANRSAAHSSTGLQGAYTVGQAVNRLLAGTGLAYAANDHTLEFFPASEHPNNHPTPSNHDTAPSGTRPRPSSASAPNGATQSTASSPSLHEVIVTGTHISGGPPPSAPIISITQREIQESGYQTVEQVMDALPENFNELGSEANNSLAENDAGNVGSGAAVDLMGLGYDSTLVLVNGHRLAPAGPNGAFTDISVIPLGAIKRIDVMTDGASAIYGADAIGGVVNYVLKNRLRGGTTTLEYGAVTHGDLKDYRAAQSYGFNWTSGHALLSYEYHDETPLSVADRRFSASLAPGDLTPGLTQNSVYLTAGERLNRRFRLHAHVFYSRRRDTESGSISGIFSVGYADTKQSSYALGSTIDLKNSWQLNTRVSYGSNDTSETSIDGTLAGRNELATGSLVANGLVWRLPSGPLKGAIGAQFRYESLSDEFTGQFVSAVKSVRAHRNVASVFIEGKIPILRSSEHDRHRLLVSADVAARVDHYSEFGTAFNPRIGLAWRVLRSLKVRGTISSSFKAPNFYELYSAQDTALVNSPEPGLPAGKSVALLFLFGANPNLTAEKAVQWTAGMDFSPEDIPGLTAHLTYYNVNFRQRIADVGIPLLSALDQGTNYAAYIERNPSSAQIFAATHNIFGYENLTAYPGLGPVRTLSDVVAIANNRFQNIGRTRTSGVNITGRFVHAVRHVLWSVGLNAAYIFNFKNTPEPGEPSFSVLSTLNNPVNFKARAEFGMQSGPVGLHTFVNYVNHYSDPMTGVPVRIASWTTVNVTGSYRLFKGNGGWGKTRLLISCVNCFNRAPPAVRLQSDYLGYDPENANPLGRFVTATLSIRW